LVNKSVAVLDTKAGRIGRHLVWLEAAAGRDEVREIGNVRHDLAN